MMNRFFAMMLSAMLVLSMTLLPAQAANDTGFSDVPEGHWAEAAIQTVSAGGLMVGDAGKFMPNDPVNKDQLMMVLSRVKGYETVSKSGYWAYQAVENALAQDWGFFKDTIMPSVYSTPCSRQVAYTAMIRALGADLPEVSHIKESDIPDFNSIESSRRSDILKAYATGLTEGVDATRSFSPNGTLTRAQLATILYRLGITKAAAFTAAAGADACSICGSTTDVSHYTAHGKDVVLCAAHYADLTAAAGYALPVMESMGKYYEKYGLADVTGDGIPEIFSDQGVGIYHWYHGSVMFGEMFESMTVNDIYYDSATQRVMAVSDNRAYYVGSIDYTLFQWTEHGFETLEFGYSSTDAKNAAVEDRISTLESQMTKLTYSYKISTSPEAILTDMVASLS